MIFYKLKNKETPWGDYGNLLLTGILDEFDGHNTLERTGPYIPKIADYGLNQFLVSSDFKEALLSSELTGFEFSEVKLTKAVKIDWTSWDFNKDEPPIYPKSGEPYGYIDEQDNDEELLKSIQPIWKLKIISTCEVQLREGKEWWDKIVSIHSSNWPDTNFAIPKELLFTIVDESTKNWLESNAGEWLDFEQLESVKTL